MARAIKVRVESYEEFSRDWNKGISCHDMAIKHGIGKTSVSNYARKLGLKSRYGEESLGLPDGDWVMNVRTGVQHFVPAYREMIDDDAKEA